VTGLEHAPLTPADSVAEGSRLGVEFELRRVATWVQLVSFCAVGASGYVVNLTIYSALLTVGVAFVPAAVCSFLVAVANNFTLNRLLTFRDRRGCVVRQGARYLSVSVIALIANIVLLTLLVWGGVGEVPAQGIAIVLVTPVSFLGNKLWSFGR
jgi:putative flippase GtrA